MRIVAGELRGRRILSPDGLDTRPTTDRVREAVFNALASLDNVVDASVVDLFAGTGAMGLEALSRGAAHCRFVERDHRALRLLRENVATLGLADRATVIAADAATYGATMAPADLVLADPPYGFPGWAALLEPLRSGFVVAESDRAVPAAEGWEVVREKRYGRTFVSFLRRADELP
jgi:16S rRNA (guanine966-N2)-methyltransferase